MKLTPQDELLLKKLLCDVVLYQETFEEVYDHLVTALEKKAAGGNLYTNAYNILEEDFGGYYGVVQMERSRKSYVEKDLNTKYILCLKAYLRNPLIVLGLLLLPVTQYFLCVTYKLSFLMPLVLIFVFACAPWCYILLQKYRSAVMEKNYKDRILTETVLGSKIQMPLALAVSMLFLGSLVNISGIVAGRGNNFIIAASGAFFIAVLLNFAIFFRVYFREFKNSAAYDLE